MSRNLPQVSDGVVEGRGGFWHVRPGGKSSRRSHGAYEARMPHHQRSPAREYWRLDDRPQIRPRHLGGLPGETVRGYAFIKDHKVLEARLRLRLPPRLQSC
jgi:hypothetical protein